MPAWPLVLCGSQAWHARHAVVALLDCEWPLLRRGARLVTLKPYSSKAFMALLVMFASLTRKIAASHAMHKMEARAGQHQVTWLTRPLVKCVHVACPARNRRGWNTFIDISADRADAASLQALAVSY